MNTRRIARGDLDTPIGYERGGEFGTLAETFDNMRIRLRESMDEIHDWNRELSRRVRKRTEACTAAQEEAQKARSDLQDIIDGLSDELVVVSRDFRVLHANATVREQWKESLPTTTL